MTTITHDYPTWKHVWRLVQFRPWQYVFNMLALLIVLLSRLGLGLVLRHFFNLVTANSQGIFRAYGRSLRHDDGFDRSPAWVDDAA